MVGDALQTVQEEVKHVPGGSCKLSQLLQVNRCKAMRLLTAQCQMCFETPLEKLARN